MASTRPPDDELFRFLAASDIRRVAILYGVSQATIQRWIGGATPYLLVMLAAERPGDVAKRLGVPAGTVRQWKKRLEQAGHQLPAWPPGPPKRTTEATP